MSRRSSNLQSRVGRWGARASYVAAYFAISGIVAGLARKGRGSDSLAVWVMNVDVGPSVAQGLEVIQVPSGNNANLAAQAGWFSLLRVFEGKDLVALDRFFIDEPPFPPTELKKVTLPISEAPALFNLCRLYGITGATLFPSYYGAALAALDYHDFT